jgi:hypothetical protein
MKQYKWEVWFVLTVLVLCVGLFIGTVAQTQKENLISISLIIAGIISAVPCLIIGLKPVE